MDKDVTLTPEVLAELKTVLLAARRTAFNENLFEECHSINTVGCKIFGANDEHFWGGFMNTQKPAQPTSLIERIITQYRTRSSGPH